MNKNYFSINLQFLFSLFVLILFLFVFLIFYILFFGSVILCDDGSINSASNIVETINLDEDANHQNNEHLNANCSTVFQEMIRRRLY
jgi:ABC-type protease/lipase transport system fused ATPase/permease subunit